MLNKEIYFQTQSEYLIKKNMVVSITDRVWIMIWNRTKPPVRDVIAWEIEGVVCEKLQTYDFNLNSGLDK